tara:strand:+ start:659 stop:850 length:192 start_codon:yes stop_codon:yes gene_type:complete
LDNVSSQVDAGMGAEDVTFFVTGQNIPSVYWAIGGSSMVEVDAQIKGGHHCLISLALIQNRYR